MKHLLVGLALALGLALAAPPSVAYAFKNAGGNFNNGPINPNNGASNPNNGGGNFNNGGGSFNNGGGSFNNGGGSQSVPELDPNSAGAGIVILLGGVAYILSRQREDLA